MPTLANVSIKDNSTWTTLLNMIYPVGSFYLSSNSTSPASRFGGSWSQLNDDKYLRCGTWGSGGSNSASHTHSLSSNGGAKIDKKSGDGASGTTSPWLNIVSVPTSRKLTGLSSDQNLAFNTNQCNISAEDNYYTTALEGYTDSSAITVTPNYREVYCWYRTA